MSDILIRHLKREEGFRAHAYQDHLGYWTIGYGRMIDKRKNGHISHEEAEMLLSNDVSKVLGELNSRLHYFKGLDEVRQAVLASMAFQMGVNGLLSFHLTLNSVELGLYEDASRHMLLSRWAEQTPQRALRLSHAMRTGSSDYLL